MVDSITDSNSDTQLPDPLVEEPPNTRWCDIVMKGGIASGVVYPWSILELARKYRFRNIGGTSVGAMAAAIAAACEYGRRRGLPHSYEALRQLPSELGKDVTELYGTENAADQQKTAEAHDGNIGLTKTTLMLSLFQPTKEGQRLFRLFVLFINQHYENYHTQHVKKSERRLAMINNVLGVYTPFYSFIKPLLKKSVFIIITFSAFVFFALDVLKMYGETNLDLVTFLIVTGLGSIWTIFQVVFVFIGIIALLLVYIVLEVRKDFQNGIIKNDLGLCRGSSQTEHNGKPIPALIEWIHEAIQRGAGLQIDGTPLTFEDLWNAPLWPGGPSPALDKSGTPTERSINLEMITTNVTHGRPYRLPLPEDETRLFYEPDVWSTYFPSRIMKSLFDASEPYTPLLDTDPSPPSGGLQLRELPNGKLPIVVAARLSLSFPILFSTVPLYAIDFERQTEGKYPLRLCRFSDGGLSSNFPVHFFDSALPRWPTFGLSLEERNAFNNKPVWMPLTQEEGGFDIWNRVERFYTKLLSADFDRINNKPQSGKFSRMSRFLRAAYFTSKDWRDKTAIQMPHVRRRVVRLALKSKEGEGQFNIAMPREQILEMASVYGTASGKLLCETYNDDNGKPGEAWQEHLWVRLQVLLEGLDDLLKNFSAASTSKGHTLDARTLLQAATTSTPVKSSIDTRQLSNAQRDELYSLIDRVSELQNNLFNRQEVPHTPEPSPELSLRPPL